MPEATGVRQAQGLAWLQQLNAVDDSQWREPNQWLQVPNFHNSQRCPNNLALRSDRVRKACWRVRCEVRQGKHHLYYRRQKRFAVHRPDQTPACRRVYLQGRAAFWRAPACSLQSVCWPAATIELEGRVRTDRSTRLRRSAAPFRERWARRPSRSRSSSRVTN